MTVKIKHTGTITKPFRAKSRMVTVARLSHESGDVGSYRTSVWHNKSASKHCRTFPRHYGASAGHYGVAVRHDMPSSEGYKSFV
ncbi:MAG: hypothetical protein R8G66_18120 [Cytophagales bacterium]|nr:hypothetical protein [Cytophagales bacterium]